MAQTVDEVKAEIITEKAAQPALAPLNSTSNTAIWNLWVFITAQVIVFFEQVMDLFKIDIQNLVNNNAYGTKSWWQTKMLAFQYGDTVAYINNIFQYAVVDPTKQIISFCSITTLNGIVQIKVAGNSRG